MSLNCGIVGLPNVGKSTIFNALTSAKAASANYPFCTIDPNIGIVPVPDERVDILEKLSHSAKKIPAIVEFYDIAGLVRGASKGEGLGNKFLSHIREVEAIVHVVRLFEDSNVVDVSDKINPEDDIKTIETELILADLETVNKQKEPKGSSAPKEAFAAYEVVKKIKIQLDKGVPVREQMLNEDELIAIKPLNLLTIKPVVYVFNISEQQLQNKEETEKKIKEIIDNNNFLYFCAKLESDIVALDPNDQKEYLSQYGLEETGLNRLIKKSYEILGLISFLTAGVIEARAWTIKKGWLAPQAAGTIHTDFEKKFIKADVIPYQKFIEAPGWTAAREKGLVQTTGKDYEMKDGEVVEFKIGA